VSKFLPRFKDENLENNKLVSMFELFNFREEDMKDYQDVDQ